MEKQPPFGNNRLPYHVTYNPGQPPNNYEDRQSISSSSFPVNPNFSYYVGHPHYPTTVAPSGPSQWSHPSNVSGHLAENEIHPGVASGSQSTQGAVISIPSGSTSSFNAKTSRQDVNVNEAETILEEKRQRNTAASARFRARKKERNQHLEQALSELSTRADELEREASDLRRENTWLKEIVIMKGRQNLSTMSASGEVSSSRADKASSSTASTSGIKGSSKKLNDNSCATSPSTNVQEDSASGSDSE